MRNTSPIVSNPPANPPLDEFQKRLQEMSAEEIRQRLYLLPFEKLQQIFVNPRPSPPTQRITIQVRLRRGIPVELVVTQEGWKKLKPFEQVSWTCEGGRLEIRFDPVLSPFAGNSFEVPQRAKAFSGTPLLQKLQKMLTFRYTILVTTPEGYFLTKEAEITIEKPSKYSAQC
ncbi:MAG: hypothetical protein JST85_25865 [Acidobacteria bacterium]|nr:hypothetical protein [Acidobacteriota bacterium]